MLFLTPQRPGFLYFLEVQNGRCSLLLAPVANLFRGDAPPPCAFLARLLCVLEDSIGSICTLGHPWRGICSHLLGPPHYFGCFTSDINLEERVMNVHMTNWGHTASGVGGHFVLCTFLLCFFGRAVSNMSYLIPSGLFLVLPFSVPGRPRLE